MSDPERLAAQEALGAARTNIASSMAAMDAVSASGIAPLAPGLSEATLNLLASIRQTVTTLTLAFKPPLTAAGITKYLSQAEDEMGRLASCVIATGGGESVLSQDWKEGVQSIGSEMQRLFGVMECGVVDPTKEYLAQTGIVWDLIDLLRARLPADEISAVTQRWEMQKSTMRDAWSEFKEMLEDAGSEEEEEDDPFGMGDDDEWGELQKAMNGNLGSGEKRRAEAAKPLFGLHQILHAALPRYFPLLRLDPEESYGGLLDAGGGVVAAFDTAVSAFYPKQDVSEILAGMDGLNEANRAVVAAVRARLSRSAADKEKIEAALGFLSKWEDRLDTEVKSWNEARLSMAELGDALE